MTVAEVVIAPDFVHQYLTSEDAAWRLGQQSQQIKELRDFSLVLGSSALLSLLAMSFSSPVWADSSYLEVLTQQAHVRRLADHR